MKLRQFGLLRRGGDVNQQREQDQETEDRPENYDDQVSVRLVVDSLKAVPFYLVGPPMVLEFH
jgi:hypothetical protein